MIDGHAEFNVAKVAGAEGTEVAAGDAQFFHSVVTTIVGAATVIGGTQQGIIQPPWQGGAEGIVR